MTTVGRFRYIRLMILIVPVFSLCSCATAPQTNNPDPATVTSQQATHSSTAAQATRGSLTAGADDAKVFSLHEEITPKGSVEKNQLAVSYSLQPIPGRQEQLIRLTLIFRNFQNTYKSVRPRIALVDAQGHTLRHYPLKQFVSMSSRSQWANVYWLKSNYNIPPQGIAIGELVYHCKQIDFPLKLTVQVDKDNFSFNAG